MKISSKVATLCISSLLVMITPAFASRQNLPFNIGVKPSSCGADANSQIDTVSNGTESIELLDLLVSKTGSNAVGFFDFGLPSPIQSVQIDILDSSHTSNPANLEFAGAGTFSGVKKIVRVKFTTHHGTVQSDGYTRYILNASDVAQFNHATSLKSFINLNGPNTSGSSVKTNHFLIRHIMVNGLMVRNWNFITNDSACLIN